jgi:cysteine sulfinate desulfinase/cysteine desulfurase-like protein
MGLSNELAYSSVRFSIGKDNTMEEMEYAVKKISGIVNDLRR